MVIRVDVQFAPFGENLPGELDLQTELIWCWLRLSLSTIVAAGRQRRAGMAAQSQNDDDNASEEPIRNWKISAKIIVIVEKNASRFWRPRHFTRLFAFSTSLGSTVCALPELNLAYLFHLSDLPDTTSPEQQAHTHTHRASYSRTEETQRDRSGGCVALSVSANQHAGCYDCA